MYKIVGYYKYYKFPQPENVSNSPQVLQPPSQCIYILNQRLKPVCMSVYISETIESRATKIGANMSYNGPLLYI